MNIHHETLQEQFEMLYGELDLEFLRFDNEKIVAKDPLIDRVVSLELNGFDPKKDDIDNFNSIDDFKKVNSDLIIFNDKGFHLKNYSEFLIAVSPTDSEVLEEDVIFKLNGCDIRIGEPSSLFKFLFGYMSRDKNMEGWDYFQTISIEGAPIKDIENTVETAIFLFASNMKIDLYDYPKVYKFVSWDKAVIDYLKSTNILESTNDYKVEFYQEALALYNIGKRNSDPISFYRVLEFFFLINYKSHIIEIVEHFNSDKEETKLINEIRKVYTNSEESLLTYLLNSIGIEDMVKEAYKLSLISDEDKRSFIKGLYIFRNSMVHSKEESKFEIIIPISIIDDHINNWTNILEILALKAIKKFCF